VWLAKILYTGYALDLSKLINLGNNSMNQSNSNAIQTPSENVVNRLVEIFDVEDFNGFLELTNQVEEPT
jgi:hypothetical protein